MPNETQKEKIMRLLHCTAEEAEEVLAYDKLVEKDEPTPYDLPPEKAKNVRAFTSVENYKVRTAPNKRDKTKTRDAEKSQIIREIVNFLNNSASFEVQNLSLPNAEREIAFSVGNSSFSLTLVRHTGRKRTKKGS